MVESTLARTQVTLRTAVSRLSWLTGTNSDAGCGGNSISSSCKLQDRFNSVRLGESCHCARAGALVALLVVLHSCGDRRHSKQHVKWGPEGCCGSALLPVATYSTGLPLSARGMKWVEIALVCVVGEGQVCGRGGSGVW